MDFVIIFLLIACNALLAMAELSLVSSRKARLEELAQGGNARARMAVDLTGRIDDVFSTVQLGITLIGILAGVYSGATFADRLTEVLEDLSIMHSVAAPIAYIVVVSAITFLSIIFGELIPKRLAVAHPEQWALRLAPLLSALSKILKPFVRALNLSSQSVMRITGVLHSAQHEITEDEIKLVMEEGREAGIIAEGEQTIVERALTLGDRPVSSLMTPRREIVWIDSSESETEQYAKIVEAKHTWYPVCDRVIDKVQGMVCLKDLLTPVGTMTPVHNAILPAIFVPANTTVLKIIEQFRKDRLHLALVVDEHGSFEGLITVHDISSAILGELPERDKEYSATIVQREDGSYLIDATLPIQAFEESFSVNLAEENDAHEFQTLAGFVLHKLGYIPETGAVFEHGHFRFEIVDMDGNRVDKLLVTKIVINDPNPD